MLTEDTVGGEKIVEWESEESKLDIERLSESERDRKREREKKIEREREREKESKRGEESESAGECGRIMKY